MQILRTRERAVTMFSFQFKKTVFACFPRRSSCSTLPKTTWLIIFRNICNGQGDVERDVRVSFGLLNQTLRIRNEFHSRVFQLHACSRAAHGLAASGKLDRSKCRGDSPRFGEARSLRNIVLKGRHFFTRSTRFRDTAANKLRRPSRAT